MVSLNVWALPAPLGRDVPERMRAIGQQLVRLAPDLVALQEVWTRAARDTLIRSGRDAGLAHAWHNEASLGGSGLLVLSRLPIRRARFERFAIQVLPQHVRHIDTFGGKGVVALELGMGDRRLTFLDTHLHARYGRDVDHEYRAHRTGQVIDVALAAQRSSHALLAAGDFNFQEHDAEYEILTGLTGLRDVAARLGRRQNTLMRANPYRHGGASNKRVDLLFTRGGNGQRWIARSIQRVFDDPIHVAGSNGAYSDHAGLLAELELSPGDAGSPSSVDPAAVALASRLLFEGRRAAERRRRDGRAWAGAGLGGAALASAGLLSSRVSRRRLLRASLAGAGTLALMPGLGLSILSEVYVPREIRAFDRTAARLTRLAASADPAVRRASGPAGSRPGPLAPPQVLEPKTSSDS